ncbi:MAG: hypothetical protein LKI58_06560 [Actinomyces sp.]|jgi:hypothetical protein|nr:hypothetical protein [Actinomyces sp.]MCI1641897.1 hypothetical protein [Actinomyces sp.]MCI1661910.1 hypothetical protein [Actinomyces sp.]MCI1691258.1 hypothetical protein [Actinomyces sp.]MCI1787713.1 hypothetical protein [Actinomyces sp.]MCI1830380.1 hypothetical protein [Actinomyces sp.]
MTTPGATPAPQPSPWLGIGLEVYEQHMAHPVVGQLAALREVMGEQLTDHPARRVAILGIAGGNGLDRIDAAAVDAVYGYDLNPDYLAACDARHRARFGDRLRLIQASVDRTLQIEPVDLLIANLFIEYVGVPEFAAFAAANAERFAVLSCVTQRDTGGGFVSRSPFASAFDHLAQSSFDIDVAILAAALERLGLDRLRVREHELASGKVLVRQDFAAPR